MPYKLINYVLLAAITYTNALYSISPENIFSAGPLSYRHLLLDTQSDSLYVGANGNLYRLWAYNINDTSTEGMYANAELPVSKMDAEDCEESGHKECVNGVRLMFLKDDKRSLLVCSSNAMKPQLRELDALTLKELSPPQNVIGICSAFPDLNTTAVYVEWGNPDDIPAVYSGIRMGIALNNYLIYRPPLVKNNKEVQQSMRTIFTDLKWLNEPEFVASLSIGKYVYFFFRETAVERESCGHTIYSRVARLCKRDIGGKNVLRQVWTSFVKARLNCSISATYFDEIQSVQSVDGPSDVYFYATFTTLDTVFGGSAVCFMSQNAIDELFNEGSFVEQTTNSTWTITPHESVPKHRPGSCSSNSAAISDSDLQFTRSHLIMAEAVSCGKPLMTLHNEMLTYIAIDTLASTNIVYVYSQSSQRLYKLLHKYGDAEKTSQLLETFTLRGPRKVHTMALLRGKYLYLAGEDQVSQYQLVQCTLHKNCMQCAQDPYCSWNSDHALCYKREASHSSAIGWITDETDVQDACSAHVQRKSLVAIGGDSVQMKCPSEESTWLLNDVEVTFSDKLHITTRGDLIILNVSAADSGSYRCSINGAVVIVYDLTVDEADCAHPVTLTQFKAKYRDWCKKLISYKHSAMKWRKWYDNNAANCPNQWLIDDHNRVSVR